MEVEKTLLEERARVWEQMKPVLDKADAEKRGLNAEEHQEYERMEGELTKLDERIDILQKRESGDERDTELRERAARLAHAGGNEPERNDPQADAIRAQEQEFLKWVRGEGAYSTQKEFEVDLGGLSVNKYRGNVASDAGAFRVRDMTSERALVEGTASAGGHTVPTTFRASLYEYLIENSAVRRTRSQIITTGSGEKIVWPMVLAHPSAGTITAEAAAFAANEPTFGQGTLDAYKYTGFIQVSYELVQDKAVDLLGYLARAFGVALANGSGAHYITGTGSSQPMGVITAGSNVVSGTGSAAAGPSADDLIDLFYAVKEPYAVNGEWLTRRATVGKIRKLKDTTGQYLWQPSLQLGQPDSILGHPVFMDPNVPAAGTAGSSIAFGDFSTFIIRDVGSVRFERSDDFAFQNDLISFRAALRTDSELIDRTGAIGVYKHGTVA